MNNVKKLTVRIFVYLIIGSMALMITNKAIFLHAHEVNGTLVYHAHPYNKTTDTYPVKSHYHTDKELLFLANLELLFPFLLAFIAILLDINKHRRNPELKLQYAFQSIPSYHGRAPPVIL